VKSRFAPLVVTLTLVVLSGLAGAWIGSQLWAPQPTSHEQFHDKLFSELHLSERQDELMEALELLHGSEIDKFKKELANANSALADMLETNENYGVEIETAIGDVHSAMFDLQKVTVRHLYEMREILDPSQKVIFDRHVSDNLREITQ